MEEDVSISNLEYHGIITILLLNFEVFLWGDFQILKEATQN